MGSIDWMISQPLANQKLRIFLLRKVLLFLLGGPGLFVFVIIYSAILWSSPSPYFSENGFIDCISFTFDCIYLLIFFLFELWSGLFFGYSDIGFAGLFKSLIKRARKWLSSFASAWSIFDAFSYNFNFFFYSMCLFKLLMFFREELRERFDLWDSLDCDNLLYISLFYSYDLWRSRLEYRLFWELIRAYIFLFCFVISSSLDLRTLK